jgi:hypothetical protein
VLRVQELLDGREPGRGRRLGDAELEAGAPDEIHVPAHFVIEHGDVPRGLVCDEDVIAVLVELVQDAAHRDDVVVRMRREHDDPLTGRQLAAAADLGHQRVEHLPVERAC